MFLLVGGLAGAKFAGLFALDGEAFACCLSINARLQFVAKCAELEQGVEWQCVCDSCAKRSHFILPFGLE